MVGLMLDHSLRRRANLISTSGQRILSAIVYSNTECGGMSAKGPKVYKRSFNVGPASWIGAHM